MYIPDYKSMKLDQQERIDNAALARTIRELRREQRTAQLARYRTAIHDWIASIWERHPSGVQVRRPASAR